jgi:hypothetical protein
MDSIQKTIDINLAGLISGAKDGPNVMGIKSDQVTDKEVQNHWQHIKREWREKDELVKIFDEEMAKEGQVVNHNLRYQETLMLNKKGYQPVFKSITRKKRDTQHDGKNPGLDKVPPVAHYKPRY